MPRDLPFADALAARYRTVRARSRALAAPLSAEDAMVQSMDDTSPSKWHLAHTTWFFERFVLALRPDYRAVDPGWDYLFNSYYQSVGPMHARPHRGLLSRPSLAQVLAYRDEIDARMARGFEAGDFAPEALRRITLGSHHEQQHQELLLTDIKHAFWCNPLRPAYRDDLALRPGAAVAMAWIAGDERIVEVGAPSWPEADAFAYDNESPRHRVLVPAHALASRPVSNAEYRAFIADGGYRDAALWLSAGWTQIQAQRWTRPLYWDEDLAHEFTLGGARAIDPHAPVCHLSYFEAEAFAHWAGARLPTEAEWESHAATQAMAGNPAGNFADSDALHPQAASGHAGSDADLQQLFGDVWEWTASAYTPYPGFRALPGALGEYNGKFMCGQQVLRGGSCATPRDHVRPSYRNFFTPPDRWQFSGLRLAKDRP
ncbi:MAG: ergothioneine biosynthesis protein EgtB [Lysobacter sp.]